MRKINPFHTAGERRYNLEVREPLCSVYRPFVINYHKATVSTIRDWLWRNGITARGWSVGSLLPCSLLQLRRSLSALSCSAFRDLWNSFSLNNIIWFLLPKRFCISLRIKRHAFYSFLRVCSVLLLQFQLFLWQNRRLVVETRSDVRDGFINPS